MMMLGSSGDALFAGSAQDFVRMAPAGDLTKHLAREFQRRYGGVNDSEIRAWKHSLAALANVVKRSDLSVAGVGVELRLPSTSRRIDASLVAHDQDGERHVVLVELKQWDRAEPSPNPDNVIVGGQEKLHPSVQVTAYADYLREAHSAFTEHGFGLSALAYLHNMRVADAAALRGAAYADAIRESPVCVRGEEDELAGLLARRLGGGDGMRLLPMLVAGRYSPSKKLIDGIALSLGKTPAWTLIDEQRLAFNTVRGLVDRAAKRHDEKACVIVLGGPGTGKSVIAAHLVVAMNKGPSLRAAHTTASKAFTTNLRAIGGRASSAVFRWNKDFAHKLVEENGLDVLVIDEAHRVRKTSNTQYTRRAVRSEMTQTNELIRAARVSVFLMDERQNVSPDEIGSAAEVRRAAAEMGVPLHEIRLDTQFRCNGSSAYIEWVDALFSSFPAPVLGWREAGEYDLRLFDEPEAMEEAIHAEIARGYTGRLVAGYCWPWSDPNDDGSLEPDVEIGGWARPWNEKSPEQRLRNKGATPRPERHPYTKWATTPEGVGQVGCIYSAQGFEFDFCGVILGDDLVWREGKGWVADREASFDNKISRRRLTQDSLRALLQHTYRVLMTRGMRGTFVYSTDDETRDFLRSLVEPKSDG